MESLVVCGGSYASKIANSEYGKSFGTIVLHGALVGCGLVPEELPSFDPKSANNLRNVLLKKLAFSCNYRDKSLTIQTAMQANQEPDEFVYSGIGSDFVAEVIAAGDDVTSLKVGDRVVSDGSYPEPRSEFVLHGIATNEASNVFQVLHEHKLVKIPDNISIEEAAGMSIGAQTSYSLIRRARPKKGDFILVTSAKSVTSLFAIAGLKAKGFDNVYALSSSHDYDEELMKLGVKEVVRVDYNHDDLIIEDEKMQRILKGRQGFDVVIDPFIDTYLFKLTPILNTGARYVTCGIQIFDTVSPSRETLLSTFVALIAGNLQILGNCLGSHEDLLDAINDVSSGKLKIPVDTVFAGDQVVDFFKRSYLDKKRFGNVVYRYS